MASQVEMLKEKGNTCFRAGRYLEAVSHFSEALSLDPNNYILYSNRSAAYANMHRYEEALRDGEMAVNLKPDWAKAYSRVATAYFALESWDNAVVAYMQVDSYPQLLLGPNKFVDSIQRRYIPLMTSTGNKLASVLQRDASCCVTVVKASCWWSGRMDGMKLKYFYLAEYCRIYYRM